VKLFKSIYLLIYLLKPLLNSLPLQDLMEINLNLIPNLPLTLDPSLINLGSGPLSLLDALLSSLLLF